AVAVAFVAGGGKETTVIAGGQPAQAAGGQTTDGDSDAQSGRGSDAPVSVPLADITGEASFYTAQVDGGEVSFFVVRGSDGDVRSAFNACQVCFQEKLGYRQESDVMVCNNCGRTFPVDQVGVEHGGCNPIPLEATVNGDSFTFAGDALASGAALFK
ncbi:MAG: DUF2318 domain-containing protein, partial [Actinobacteria bacterium]|nr:DUF2318 domain-containing protein [Actinomycetota bacterium]